MSNPFYIYSGAFIPGILARAEAEAAEFQSVQTGFALLAIQGTDSGSANAYSVVTKGGQNGIYTDGMIVEFKAKNANTGACTITVDSGSTVSLTDSQGVALASGVIKANTWYRALYNTTYSAFTLIAPSSLTTTNATVSGGAPANKVGLTAAGGVATTVLPSDATFALDQSIAPTWTGAHIFSAAVTFNGTVTFSGGLSLTGNASQYAATLTGNSGAGVSLGLRVNAGTNASDFCVRFSNQTGATDYFRVLGEGSVLVGNPTGGGQGVGTLNAAGLFINGVSVSASSAANPTAKVGLTVVNGSATSFMRSDAAPPLDQSIAPTWTAAHVHSGGAFTSVSITAGVNQNAVVITGGTNTANTYLMTLTSGQGSGFSSGMAVTAGTTSGDAALLIRNATASTNMLQIDGTGASTFTPTSSISVSVATVAIHGLSTQTNGFLSFTNDTTSTLVGGIGGGAVVVGQGVNDLAIWARSNFVVGTAVSATLIFKITSSAIQGLGPVNGGLVDMTPDEGTFTMTYSDSGTLTTATAVWSRKGNQVTLLFPVGTGAAASNTFTASGLPASIRPARAQQIKLPTQCLEDNSATGQQAKEFVAAFAAASGTVTFWYNQVSTGFTNTGTKGMQTACTVTYLLN